MEELELLEVAETKQEKLLTTFLANIKKVARAFMDSIIDIMDDLEMKSTTRMQDWQTVTRYRLILRTVLANAGYDVSVEALLKGMTEVSISIESYYEPYGMSKYSDFFHTAGQQALDRVKTQLIDVIPETAFIEPVSQALENAVMRGQSLPDMRRQLKEIVVESELPANYVYNQAKQSLWMFHRNYSGSIGTALDLKHFYYDGVAVQHSRGFCLKRKGKVFTKEEVEEWVKEDWQGKIPGTTKESIFWLCGGYNCIDVLRPITEQLYKRLKNNN
ncbi:hypothetical protein GCM10007423_39840 [Dyadobacter endophyticus]|uniref:DUF4942 domain-containing protein n=1 Tax=Dyadobacter endophyticus TaxID=1749036 RepID=A0ABQ1YZP6_9BACT|nr:hypothetical protein [Dyadobacter endophyticus]GGH42871.1 hypothetical protein GCM10007423_39840 [Dyadobacter endophyticus]